MTGDASLGAGAGPDDPGARARDLAGPWRAAFAATELDRAGYAEFRDRIVQAEAAGVAHRARRYPGYPTVPLPRAGPRLWPPLDRVLAARRSHRALDEALPPADALGRLLVLAHGVTASDDRGPVPSSGGLQALELYVVALGPGWLPAGAYHYDRPAHALARLDEPQEVGDPAAWREAWRARVVSMDQFEGGALLWVLVGDGARVAAKYGPRAVRLLTLEAGHLMQDLCLASTSLGLATLPLGGFFERDVARALQLPRGDLVLYAGACGRPRG